MSGSVYGDTTEPGAASDRRPNSLVDSTLEVDSRKLYDLTLNIRPGAKNEEDPEATRKEGEKKEASAAEKEHSDRKETTDDPSSSISNDRDTPEEAHGSGRTKDGTGKEKSESSMWTGFQDSLRHFLNCVRYVTTSLLRHCSHYIPGIFKIHNKESDKKDESGEETEYQHFEAAPVVTGFDDLPDLVVFKIFKWIGAKDRLGLEGVNRKWKELLTQSWKHVEVLEVWADMCSPSLTFDNIGFLRTRVAPYVKILDFRGFWQAEESVVGRLIFWALSSPPCALKEVLFGDMIVDRATVFRLTCIGNQITAVELWDNEGRAPNPEKLIEDTEDGRTFFDYFPNLIRLECMFPGIYRNGDYNRKCWDSLPSSVKYLMLDCSDGIDDLMQYLEVEEPVCSIKELHLELPVVGLSLVDERTLSKLVDRFPNLEVLELKGNSFCSLSRLELLSPLENLRKLYVDGKDVDLGFLSSALSFEFRKKLELLHIHVYDEDLNGKDPEKSLLQQQCLENLRLFPNLKELSLKWKLSGRKPKKIFLGPNVAGIEQIVKACKKLERITLVPCPELNNEALEIIGANCRGLRFLAVSLCPRVTEEGVEALVRGISFSKNLEIHLCRTGVSENSENMSRLMDTYGFRYVHCSTEHVYVIHRM